MNTDTFLELPAKKAVTPYVRWMILRDMPEVTSIENQQYGNPWTKDEFVQCLRTPGIIGQVAELREEIHGYMMYELHQDHFRLLNLAVHPCSLRCGIGEAMVTKLTNKLTHLRRTRIVCEVRETNLRGQLFFRSMGFVCTNVLKGFYDDAPDDAYVFEYSLPECGGK